jgi:hypothetical protein
MFIAHSRTRTVALRQECHVSLRFFQGLVDMALLTEREYLCAAGSINMALLRSEELRLVRRL